MKFICFFSFEKYQGVFEISQGLILTRRLSALRIWLQNKYRAAKDIYGDDHAGWVLFCSIHTWLLLITILYRWSSVYRHLMLDVKENNKEDTNSSDSQIVSILGHVDDIYRKKDTMKSEIVWIFIIEINFEKAIWRVSICTVQSMPSLKYILIKVIFRHSLN